MGDITVFAKELLKVTTDPEMIKYLKELIEFHKSYKSETK